MMPSTVDTLSYLLGLQVMNALWGIALAILIHKVVR